MIFELESFCEILGAFLVKIPKFAYTKNTKISLEISGKPMLTEAWMKIQSVCGWTNREKLLFESFCPKNHGISKLMVWRSQNPPIESQTPP